jgi:hypothetical protein
MTRTSILTATQMALMAHRAEMERLEAEYARVTALWPWYLLGGALIGLVIGAAFTCYLFS